MKISKRVLSVLLVAAMAISSFPASMFSDLGIKAGAAEYSYNRDKAIDFAKAHCAADAKDYPSTVYGAGSCSKKWLCAEFVAECLLAGGFPKKLSATAGLSGFGGQIVNYGEKITCNVTGSKLTKVTMSSFSKPILKGDPIVILYNNSPTSGSGHVVIYSGETDSSGGLKIYAHNSRKQNELLYVGSESYPVVEMFAVRLGDAPTLSINYNINGGTVNSTKYKAVGDTICKTDGTPVKDVWKYDEPKTNGLYNAGTFGLSKPGYIFEGWSVSTTSSTIFDQNDASLKTSDIYPDIINGNAALTLYARWKSNHTHTVVTDNAVSATCLTAGLSKGSHCSKCGEIITAQNEIPALGHKFSSSYTIDTPATCTTQGVKSKHCSRCTEVTSVRVIPATGHIYADDSDTTCNVCGYSRDCTHSFGDWETETDVTCTSAGTRYRECSICYSREYEIISAPGHSYSDSFTIDTPATCMAAGVMSKHCSRCLSVTDVTSIPAAGHISDSGKVTKKATCTATGKKTFKCTECGETLKTETINKTAHKASVVPGKEATCTQEGLTDGSVCSVCNTVITEQEPIEKTPHSYVEKITKATTSAYGSIVNTCSVCGDKSTTSIAYPKIVTLSYTEKTYTGKALKPSVTVRDSKGNKIASSNYTVGYKNNTNVGKATVTITFKGNYKGTLTKTFKINPKATTVSKLTAKSKGFTATWKKQSAQTTGYQIQYSTSSKFTEGTTKSTKVTSVKTLTKTISKLKASTKYYVRIRTYKTVSKTNYYSAWSKALSVTTKR